MGSKPTSYTTHYWSYMFEEINISLFHADTYSGYFYVEAPWHELATPCGRMFLHRYLMAQKIGRKLETSEHVHHIDGDRGNNDVSNLELLSNSEHKKKHLLEKYGDGAGRSCVNCEQCGKDISRTNSSLEKSAKKQSKLFCSISCRADFNRKLTVDVDWLSEMVWVIPTTEISKSLNVSDNTVGKLCKKFAISKPPRGYWQKKHPTPGIKKELLACDCKWCGTEFIQTLEQMRKSRRSKNEGPFCSRSCTGKYGASVRVY